MKPKLPSNVKLDVADSNNCSSMAAEAAIHVRPLPNKPQPGYLAKKGNPSLEVSPLYYNPAEQTGWVYIVASKPNGIIYVGQTTNLPLRIQEHKNGKILGFTKKYGSKTLVYFEGFQRITESIERETTMKGWTRAWKIRRIAQTNPTWRDLHREICEAPTS